MEARELAVQREGREIGTPGSGFATRAVDLIVALLFLLLLAPVMLAIAAAITIESGGPAIFRQRRVGRGQTLFTVFKFRTMAVEADETVHRDYVRTLIARGRDCAGDETRPIYKLTGDSRVTRVGRLLRRSSLDELPQLWNVVRGDMSLVGPRPVVPYEVESYPAWYHGRFAVKPGLTGLWQVSGRNERTYEEMVQLDLEYARRRSLLLDLGILIKTAWVVLRGRGVA